MVGYKRVWREYKTNDWVSKPKIALLPDFFSLVKPDLENLLGCPFGMSRLELSEVPVRTILAANFRGTVTPEHHVRVGTAIRDVFLRLSVFGGLR